MIKINIGDSTFETESAFQGYAFMVALDVYGFEEGYAREIATLCDELNIDINRHYNNEHGISLVDWVCDNYNELPNDYNKVLDIFMNDLTNY